MCSGGRRVAPVVESGFESGESGLDQSELRTKGGGESGCCRVVVH